MKNLKITKTDKVEENKNNHRFFSGLTGENIALNEFQKIGFSLVKKRYKTEFGEIDLIVEDKKNKILVFVEVKRRNKVFDYSNVISNKQWKRIYNASNVFLYENNDKYKNYYIRYDAIICFEESKNIVHIENIFVNDINNDY